jgi:hypothetical protein
MAKKLVLDLMEADRGKPHWLSGKSSPELERRNERLQHERETRRRTTRIDRKVAKHE